MLVAVLEQEAEQEDEKVVNRSHKMSITTDMTTTTSEVIKSDKKDRKSKASRKATSTTT